MNHKIRRANLADLAIMCYPDPRLMQMCTPIDEVDDSVRVLIDRMFELMFAGRGVGLAAPQVGLAVRLFVASPTFQPDDRQAYVNPVIIAAEGVQDGEEGCLSFPGISCKVKRRKVATIRALDRGGSVIERTATDLEARIFQHEIDHLNGRLLVDRMGSVAKLANRRVLKDLVEVFAA